MFDKLIERNLFNLAIQDFGKVTLRWNDSGLVIKYVHT